MKFASYAAEDYTAPLLSEEQFRAQLAVEGFALSDVGEFFRTNFPSIKQKLLDFLPKFSGTKEIHPDLSDLARQASNLLSKGLGSRYLTLKDLVVQTPDGFQGEFLPYIRMLNEIGEPLYKNTEAMFGKFRFVISSFVSNPDAMAMRKNITDVYSELVASRVEITDLIGQYFNESHSSRQRLTTVVPRFADYESIVRETLENAKHTQMTDLRRIETQVKEALGLLDILERQIKTPEFRMQMEVSQETVKGVAEATYELGRYVDTVVAYYYSCLSMQATVKLLSQQLSE